MTRQVPTPPPPKKNATSHCKTLVTYRVVEDFFLLFILLFLFFLFSFSPTFFGGGEGIHYMKEYVLVETDGTRHKTSKVLFTELILQCRALPNGVHEGSEGVSDLARGADLSESTC
jgi:hypothetical protein